MEQFNPELIEKILLQIKSQGIFDQFRKDCIADVDTKPAYQNLRQRVDASVSSFLDTHFWRPDMNKNQLRDNLRKHIQASGFLETGVERIVDQVVNPKICPHFLPKVEEIVYDCIGVNRRLVPEKTPVNTVKPLETPLKSQTSNEAPKEIKTKPVVDTNTLKITVPAESNSLPNDLDSVSPPSEEKMTDAVESGEDEEISPAFELHTEFGEDENDEAINNTFYESKCEIVTFDNENDNISTSINISEKDVFESHVNKENSENINNLEDFKISSSSDTSNKTELIEPETNEFESSYDSSPCLGVDSVTSDDNFTSHVKDVSESPLATTKSYFQDSDSESTTCISSTNDSDLKNQHMEQKLKLKNISSDEHKKHVDSKHSSIYYPTQLNSKHTSKHEVYNSEKSIKQKLSFKEKEGTEIPEKKREERVKVYDSKNENLDEKFEYIKTKLERKNPADKDLKDENEIYSIKYDRKVELNTVHELSLVNKLYIKFNKLKSKKHRPSSSYDDSFNKDDHLQDENNMNKQISITNSKSDKKLLAKNKNQDSTKSKHATKHCKSNEYTNKILSLHDSDQDEAPRTVNQSQTSIEREVSSQSSNDNVAFESDGTISSASSDHLGMANEKSQVNKISVSKYNSKKKRSHSSSVKKMHENESNEFKKIKKKKLLVDVDNVDTISDSDKSNSNADSYYFNKKHAYEDNHEFDKYTSDENNSYKNNCKTSKYSKSAESNYFNKSFDSEEDLSEQINADSYDEENYHRNHHKTKNSENDKLVNKTVTNHSSYQEMKDKRSKSKNYNKDLHDELRTDQESETEKYSSQEFVQNDFTLVKFNSSHEISVESIKSELNPNIPVINYKKKKSRSGKIKIKKHKHKKRHSSPAYNVYSHHEQEETEVSKKSIRSKIKIKKETDSSGSEKRSRLPDSLGVLDSSLTENEEYSPTKAPKLASNLVDVALQDLLVESGLTISSPNEETRTTSTANRSNNSKKVKVAHDKHQQHYDKSDLYKPRPQFTQSSKRSRRHMTEPSNGQEVRKVIHR
uniref:BOD1/SHG1 domain-containing protein n=1 Tax=Clastoptera arizonana TaxID=38151 RepID=A0A1B6DAW2_9HEMI